MREGASGKNSTLLESGSTRSDSGDNLGVIRRVDDDSDVVVILGRSANHRGTSDIDVFDNRRGFSAAGHRGGKGIQVDDNEVKGFDAQFLKLLGVRVVSQISQDSAVDCGVECFDSSVEGLRETRDLADLLNVKSRLANRLTGRSRGDQRDTCGGERGREFKKPALVADGNQGPVGGDAIA